MPTTNVKILLRRGDRSEISGNTLDAGELGYTTDTNQLYIGTDTMDDEIVFGPFANAHAIIQTYLYTLSAPFIGLEIDEDLIIKNIPIVTITAGSFVVGSIYTILTDGTTDYALIGSANNTIGTTFTATGVGTGTGTATTSGAVILIALMTSAITFDVSIFGNQRRNVEVLTEAGFSQVYANMHLESHASATGKRSDLFKKLLTATVEIISVGAIVLQRQYEIITVGDTDFTLIGSADNTIGTKFIASSASAGTGTVREVATFLKYAKTECTSFFIDYSLLQKVSGITKFVRVGTIKVINGVPQGINQAKLTDENTEIWVDTDVSGTADANEFSNIEFTAVIDGSNMKINYTQDATFNTEISYTVKRWKM
jgi:hypothetical protein